MESEREREEESKKEREKEERAGKRSRWRDVNRSSGAMNIVIVYTLKLNTITTCSAGHILIRSFQWIEPNLIWIWYLFIQFHSNCRNDFFVASLLNSKNTSKLTPSPFFFPQLLAFGIHSMKKSNPKPTDLDMLWLLGGKKLSALTEIHDKWNI